MPIPVFLRALPSIGLLRRRLRISIYATRPMGGGAVGGGGRKIHSLLYMVVRPLIILAKNSVLFLIILCFSSGTPFWSNFSCGVVTNGGTKLVKQPRPIPNIACRNLVVCTESRIYRETTFLIEARYLYTWTKFGTYAASYTKCCN